MARLADFKMEKATHQYGCEGEWFVRAYDDFAKPIGSKACQEGIKGAKGSNYSFGRFLCFQAGFSWVFLQR